MSKKQIISSKVRKRSMVRHVKMATLPHKHNQYRPYVIRRAGIMVIGMIVCVLQLAQLWSTSGTVLGEQAPLNSALLLADTNNERAQRGLPALILNDALSEAASLKASDMFEKQYWAHTSPDGYSPWYWFGKVGYSYSSAGENLAKNFKTAGGVITAWMSSPEHRANIMGAQYSQVGFSVMEGMLDHRPATIVVALYGAPTTPAVAGIQDASPKETAPLQGLSPVARLGVALQSLSPITVGSLSLVLASVVIAMIAHVYRKKLPKYLQKTWYRHHGLIKAGGMSVLGVVVIFLYAGGQI